MPELPEVETVRQGLAVRLNGRRIDRVTVRRSDLRRPVPPNLAQSICGRRIERFDRRGKYLIIHLDDGQAIISHLGMSGRFSVGETPTNDPHDHLLLYFEDGKVLSYIDHRRFGLLDLTQAYLLERHELLAGIGPEPLSNSFSGPTLANRLLGKKTSIKSALLDQHVVAGLGNIYACEALFHSGLSPRRRAYTVQGKRAQRLATSICKVLREAISVGGSTLRDYAQVSGQLGYFQHRFAVYGREGKPCPGCDCKGNVRRLIQNNRSTFYCSQRQR